MDFQLIPTIHVISFSQLFFFSNRNWITLQWNTRKSSLFLTRFYILSITAAIRNNCSSLKRTLLFRVFIIRSLRIRPNAKRKMLQVTARLLVAVGSARRERGWKKHRKERGRVDSRSAEIYQSESVWISLTGLRLAARTSLGQVRFPWQRRDACVCACAYNVRAQYSRPRRVCAGWIRWKGKQDVRFL